MSWNESDTVRVVKSMDRLTAAFERLAIAVEESNTRVAVGFQSAYEELAKRDIALGQVHFAPYGSYETACGLPLMKGTMLPNSDKRDETTCFGCRSRFTNPSDADVPTVL